VRLSDPGRLSIGPVDRRRPKLEAQPIQVPRGYERHQVVLLGACDVSFVDPNFAGRCLEGEPLRLLWVAQIGHCTEN
jgi:hypothetical protein